MKKRTCNRCRAFREGTCLLGFKIDTVLVPSKIKGVGMTAFIPVQGDECPKPKTWAEYEVSYHEVCGG